MVETQEVRDSFVARLNSALNSVPGVRVGRGRNVDLYEGIKNHPSAKASKQATHKWLSGESMPSRGNMIAIADWLKVRIEWLAHGEGGMHQGATDETAPPDRVALGQALLDLATPRSRAALQRINQAATEGRLSEADIYLLDQIAARFEHKGASSANGEGSHKRLREKLLNNDPHTKK